MKAQLKRRQRTVGEVTEEVRSVTRLPPKNLDGEVRFDRVVSTGSTQLDLAISGSRIRGGGIPGGIIVEIFGPFGSGKTAVLATICTSVQTNGGQVKFLDPEGRLDKEYARIYGLTLPKDDYARPDTVTEVFQEHIWPWKPVNENVINAVGTDSLAALSTRLEMEDQDKMGMRRAKEFSEGLRKTCRLISNNNWLIACTNQVRQSTYGYVTPGGQAIPFYSSLRINIRQEKEVEKSSSILVSYPDKEGKEVKGKVDVDKVVGIKSVCRIVKSTIDDPYREAKIFIRFKYGIDDVWGNLQFLKDKTKAPTYDAVTKGFRSMDHAIRHIEKNDLEEQLREKVIDLWEEIERKFESDRKPKIRR